MKTAERTGSAIYLRGIDPDVKKLFKVACAETQVTMYDALKTFMAEFGQGESPIRKSILKTMAANLAEKTI